MKTHLGLPRAAYVEPLWLRRVYMVLVTFTLVFIGYVLVFLPMVFAAAVHEGCKCFATTLRDFLTEYSPLELIREWRSTWSGK